MPKVDLSNLPQEEIDRRLDAYWREFHPVAIAMIAFIIPLSFLSPIAAAAIAVLWPGTAALVFGRRHPGVRVYLKKLGRCAGRHIPIPARVSLYVSMIVTIFALQFGLQAAIGRSTAWSAMSLAYAGCTATALGSFLVFLGRFARTRGPLSCAKCDYTLEGFDELPYVCPECGVGLGTATSTTRTPRYRNPTMFWSGVAIMALTLACAATLIFARGTLFSLLPTDTLIRFAVTDNDALTELTTARTLTQAQIDAFTDRVLGPPEAPRERDFRTSAALDQLATWIARSQLDERRAARFYREGFTLALDAPPTARVGQPVRLSLVGDAPRHGTTLNGMLLFRGFELDGPAHFPTDPPNTLTPEFIDRRDQAFPAFYLGRFAPKHDIPRTSIVPLTPGPLTVRVRIVAALQSSFWPITVDWPADGSDPDLPPAVVRSDVIELETTIDVRE